MENLGHRAPFFTLFLSTLCRYFIGLVKANGALIFAASEFWHSSTQAPSLLPTSLQQKKGMAKGLHNSPSQLLHSFCRHSSMQLGRYRAIKKPSNYLLERLSNIPASMVACTSPTTHLTCSSF